MAESIELNDSERTVDTAEPENDTLFEVKIEIMVKDFASQKMGTSKAFIQVNANTREEFLQCVWSVVESHIRKEVVYDVDSDTYQWANYELDYQALDRFVMFYDKFSKRSTESGQISNKLLQAWTKKQCVICIVHVYGICLKKKQHYDKALKEVIQPDANDRAGAVDNTETFKCIDELKSFHSNLLATEASWLRWANWIKKQPGHERESLMKQDPPDSLMDLFKLVRIESEHIQEVRSSIAIGKRVNKSIETALPMLEDEIEDLVKLFQSGLRRSERVKALIVGLRQQLASNDNLMDGFNDALGTQENEFSQELLSRIDNVEDVDHQH